MKKRNIELINKLAMVYEECESILDILTSYKINYEASDDDMRNTMKAERLDQLVYIAGLLREAIDIAERPEELEGF